MNDNLFTTSTGSSADLGVVSTARYEPKHQNKQEREREREKKRKERERACEGGGERKRTKKDGTRGRSIYSAHEGP